MEAFFAEVRPLRICVTVTEINMNDINGVMMPGFTPLHVYTARYGFILIHVNYGRCRFASVEQKHPHRPPPQNPEEGLAPLYVIVFMYLGEKHRLFHYHCRGSGPDYRLGELIQSRAAEKLAKRELTWAFASIRMTAGLKPIC